MSQSKQASRRRRRSTRERARKVQDTIEMSVLEQSAGKTSAPEADSSPQTLRIGEVAKLVGTTPRTIRYYEEIGLLRQSSDRASGSHRLYSHDEVERLREVMRLKNLLGVSLEELKTLLAAEEARSAVRVQLRREDVEPQRRRRLLEEALGHIERQLDLVRGRAAELAKLQAELSQTRTRVRRKIKALDPEAEIKDAHGA
ncbi:MAG TPA: MerR family transcriptional regulator [Solirubrobacteraceae bacterium]|jgi:DNA-binding transcriptional MerR regulator|nr:MerR family transcriptional regulator [Solirubrobacteraceae bacterium]